MYYSNFVYCRLGTETKIITTLDQNERWTCIQDRAEDQNRKTQKHKLENIHIKDKVCIFYLLISLQGQAVRFRQNCSTNLPAFHIYYKSSYWMHGTLSKTLFSVLLYVKLYLLSSKQV